MVIDRSATPGQEALVSPHAPIHPVAPALVLALTAAACGPSIVGPFVGTAPVRARLAKCDAGDARACYELGNCLRGRQCDIRDPKLEGWNVVRRAARPYLEKSCDLGYAYACTDLVNLAELLHEGVEAARTRGASRTQGQCDQGSADGCYLLGQAHERGEGVPKDLRRAAALYAKACPPYAYACEAAARALAATGGPDAEVRRLFAEGCARVTYREERTKGGTTTTGIDHGAGACVDAARMLLLGRGGPVDLPGAIAHLERGCKVRAGRAACAELATLYREGRGVRKDDARARELLGAGCDQGDGAACEARGALEWDQATPGKEGDRRRERAIGWRHTACDQGHRPACVRLALDYLAGNRVPVRPLIAGELFAKVCSSGDIAYCVRAAELLEPSGFAAHVGPRRRAANVGCDHGQAAACEVLRRVRDRENAQTGRAEAARLAALKPPAPRAPEGPPPAAAFTWADLQAAMHGQRVTRVRGGWEVRRLNTQGLVGAPLADSGTIGTCFQPAFVSFLECRMIIDDQLGPTVNLQVNDKQVRARLEKLRPGARVRFAGSIYHVMELPGPRRVIVTLHDVAVAP
jgi:hypothetical protein